MSVAYHYLLLITAEQNLYLYLYLLKTIGNNTTGPERRYFDRTSSIRESSGAPGPSFPSNQLNLQIEWTPDPLFPSKQLNLQIERTPDPLFPSKQLNSRIERTPDPLF
ncbi:hypothetical protein ACPV3A_26120 [Paenibacillus sp. Dod16]|uniref:hypothetical protein n=1 Tax=Paenibacillus sp. Dod16 TaxID=3416392 RepID=UPI003CF9C150